MPLPENFGLTDSEVVWQEDCFCSAPPAPLFTLINGFQVTALMLGEGKQGSSEPSGGSVEPGLTRCVWRDNLEGGFVLRCSGSSGVVDSSLLLPSEKGEPQIQHLCGNVRNKVVGLAVRM